MPIPFWLVALARGKVAALALLKYVLICSAAKLPILLVKKPSSGL
jgi:hypothetical protein